MKKLKNKNIGLAITACACLALFLILTALVLFVDVAAAGESGARVGLSHINEAVFNDLGKNGAFKKITNICAGVGALTIAFFVGLFIFQWIKRKSLKKIDLDLYFALVAGVLALVFYVFFELVVVNCRPILIDGGFEKSYPSSHTMFVTVFVGVGVVEAFSRLKKEWAKWLVFAAGVCVMLLGGVGRLFAGVHWLTDVIAGYLLGGAVVFAFAYIAFRFKDLKENGNKDENGDDIKPEKNKQETNENLSDEKIEHNITENSEIKLEENII